MYSAKLKWSGYSRDGSVGEKPTRQPFGLSIICDVAVWSRPISVSAELPVLVVIDEVHLTFNARDYAKTDKLYWETLTFLTQSRKVHTDALSSSLSRFSTWTSSSCDLSNISGGFAIYRGGKSRVSESHIRSNKFSRCSSTTTVERCCSGRLFRKIARSLRCLKQTRFSANSRVWRARKQNERSRRYRGKMLWQEC